MHHVRPVRNQRPLEILEHLKTSTKYLIQVFIRSEDRLLYSVIGGSLVHSSNCFSGLGDLELLHEMPSGMNVRSSSRTHYPRQLE